MKWQYYLAFFLGILLILMESTVFAASKIDRATCTYQGHKLYGKVKIVNSFPLLKVKVVSSFPDLKVKQVNSFADQCGLWQFVDSFPDLKIQFVDSFPGIP